MLTAVRIARLFCGSNGEGKAPHRHAIACYGCGSRSRPHGFSHSGGFCVPRAGAQDAISQRNGLSTWVDRERIIVSAQRTATAMQHHAPLLPAARCPDASHRNLVQGTLCSPKKGSCQIKARCRGEEETWNENNPILLDNKGGSYLAGLGRANSSTLFVCPAFNARPRAWPAACRQIR